MRSTTPTPFQGQPRDAAEEEVRREYNASMKRTLIQKSDTHAIYKLTSREDHQKYPKTLFLKVYFQPGNDCELEKNTLLQLNDRTDLLVPRYEDSYCSGGRMLLFMTGFDSVLKIEIDKRAKACKPWTEMKLWKHLHTLAYTMKELHSLRIMHRNITPSSIFVKDDQLYLGHFEESKKIDRGVSQRFATIRGSTNYLSPQCFKAIETHSSPTYEASMKDDMWGLGRTLFDMATLCCNSSITSLYNGPQSALNTYIKSKLAGRYSFMFESILLSLLQLDWETRQQSDEFFDGILSSVYFTECVKCRKPISMVWDCPHALCEQCTLQPLMQAVKSGRNLRLCRCTQPPIFVCVQLLPDRCKKLILAVMQPGNTCGIRECTAQYSVLKNQGGEWRPYLVKCQCGAAFCSFCRAENGHWSFLLGSRPCPEFTAVKERG